MDALLIALLASAFAEMGDRTQLLAMVLALRCRDDGVVFSGIALAVIANCALSATAGWLLSDLLGSSARTLFFALPLLFAGAGLLMRPKRPDDVRIGRLGAFLTTFFSFFVLEFGDKSQFIAAGVAVRTADPVMSAVGASAGILLAMAPAIIMRQQFFSGFPIVQVRRGAGIAFLIIGALIAISALGLI
jgi:Ca2+/H+ antiporter, TMEM165/GDT1 family